MFFLMFLLSLTVSKRRYDLGRCDGARLVV